MADATVTDAQGHKHHQAFWLWVMCLTGVDYFSTLGYQPSIAFEATGLLTPFATVILVAVTLFGAFPVRRFEADLQAIRQARRLLEGGAAVAMFPEGHRSGGASFFF